MRIERLTIAPDGGERQSADMLVLDVRDGVAGDRRSRLDGSVSLLSGEAAQKIAGLGGLCTGRFMANIVTRGLDYENLAAGARLSAGESELEITRVGKRCFEECALTHEGGSCPLPKSCAFARVLRGGRIRAGDELKRIAESEQT